MTGLQRHWAGAVALLGAVALTVGLGGAGGAVAAASPILGKPVHPLRSPNGAPLHGPMNQVETSNWSGYAVAQFETGLTYTSATGTWIVPTVSLPSGFTSAYSSSWVGIGGFCGDARCHKVDSTLIQLGTEQDASSSGPTYSAWYELLPAGPVNIPLTIHAGDTITASLSEGAVAAAPVSTHPANGTHGAGHGRGPGNGHGSGGGSTPQVWTLSIRDVTAGGTAASWSTTLSYASSELSAEWIEEAPAACVGSSCSALPLADYGTATFDPGTVNGTANPALAAPDGIAMVNPNGQTSNPSLPDSESDGFNTCWGSGTTLTACSPPGTSPPPVAS